MYEDEFLSSFRFKKELDKKFCLIARAENIISTKLVKDRKFFDGLLDLGDRFLAGDVNLRIVEGMNLANEEMFLKPGEMYADLSLRYHDTMARIVILEERKAFVEPIYEACIRENGMFRAQLAHIF